MGDINRDDDTIEIAFPPRFGFGERVIARSVIRNDGTYTGKDIGEVWFALVGALATGWMGLAPGSGRHAA